MKKVLLVLAVLVSYVSYGQEKESYLKENIFYTMFESGVGEKVQIKFKISNLEKITQTEVYKLWEMKTFTNSENVAAFTEISKVLSHVEMYLLSSTQMASFFTKWGLKNQTSYALISNAEGFIYVNDKEEVCFSFPFKGQNGYGNMMFAEGYYTEFVKKGKWGERHFIN